jgi:hypothetical protein
VYSSTNFSVSNQNVRPKRHSRSSVLGFTRVQFRRRAVGPGRCAAWTAAWARVARCFPRIQIGSPPSSVSCADSSTGRITSALPRALEASFTGLRRMNASFRCGWNPERDQRFHKHVGRLSMARAASSIVRVLIRDKFGRFRLGPFGLRHADQTHYLTRGSFIRLSVHGSTNFSVSNQNVRPKRHSLRNVLGFKRI